MLLPLLYELIICNINKTVNNFLLIFLQNYVFLSLQKFLLVLTCFTIMIGGDILSTFGERFKTLRLEKKLKQEELINDFNNKYHYSFTRSAVSQYENNKRIPEIDALKDFANYFNVNLDYLIGNSDIRKVESNSTVYKSKVDGKLIEIEISKNHLHKLSDKEVQNLINQLKAVGFDVETLIKNAKEPTE